MDTQKAFDLLNLNRGICQDVIFETQFQIILDIPFSNRKGREMAKYYGFKFNGISKKWEKVDSRINWQVHTNLDNNSINILKKN